MPKNITDRPRIAQDMTATTPQHTEEAKTKEPLTRPKLNGILEELGLGNLGGDVEPLAKQGEAADTPRQDGAVQNRGQSVKDFFKAVGKGIGGFLGAIGKAFNKGFEAIKESITHEKQKAAEQREFIQNKRTDFLQETIKDLGKVLEQEFQAYTDTTTDDPKMDRVQFVATKLPDPPGGHGGIDTQSMKYVGDIIDTARDTMPAAEKPEFATMQNVVLDRLSQMPTLDIAISGRFARELPDLDKSAATFLRGNCAYTRIDKVMAFSVIPFNKVAEGVVKSTEELATRHADLSKTKENGDIGTNSMNADQAEAVTEISERILTSILDTDPAIENSFLNSIPQEYRDHLSEKANEIMNRPGTATVEDRNVAIRMMYVNSLFLRGINGANTEVIAKWEEGSGKQKMMVTGMNVAQSFLNGAANGFKGRSSPDARNMMDHISTTFSQPLEDFLVAVGMPKMTADENATI